MNMLEKLQVGWRKYKIIGIILLCIFVGVFICTILVLRPAIFNKIALNNADAAYIGTCIGGISALIVGSINVVMLYLAFREQRNANVLQNERNEIEFKKINSSIIHALINDFDRIKEIFKLELERFDVSHWSSVTEKNRNEVLHSIFIFLFDTKNHIKKINITNIEESTKLELKSEIKDFRDNVFDKNYYNYLSDAEREMYEIEKIYADVEKLLKDV